MAQDLTYFWIALSIAVVSAGYILYAAKIGASNPSLADARRPMLEIAWPLLFICGIGMWLVKLEFAAVLLLAIVVSGSIWLVDKLFFRKKRKPDQSEPAVVDMARAFFPVILVVFMVRSFWVEPFKIPSGSMKPTLLVGDFILVDKTIYGFRIPVLNKKITDGTPVQRGDVTVFRFPDNPAQDYIKRVIGLPGDTVEYKGKQISINGKPLTVTLGATVAEGGYARSVEFQEFTEQQGERKYQARYAPNTHSLDINSVGQFPNRSNCDYNAQGFTCKVPEGHYFVMGDNRDESLDSRYWGFVPDDHLRGRAFLVWLNLGAFSRIGTKIQ